MRYHVVVGKAKLFDYSGIAGIPRILNQGEQHPKYSDSLKHLIATNRAEYKPFEQQVQLLRSERDQFYTHLDKRFLLNDGQGVTFSWDDFEKMLVWALSILSEIMRVYIFTGFPVKKLQDWPWQVGVQKIM